MTPKASIYPINRASNAALMSKITHSTPRRPADLKGVSLLHKLRDRKDIDILMACGLPRGEMPAWYHEIDIYVCTSRAEGTPLPLLEAMASGKIVITTSVGIVPEISSTGVFVFDGTVHGLTSELQQVILRRKQWEWLGLENRKYVMSHRAAPIVARKLRGFLWDSGV